MDVCQSARARTGTTGLLATNVSGPQNSALCDDQDVTSRELLFEFSHQSLVHLIEKFAQFVGDVNDNGFASSSTVHFFGSRNVKVTEGSLEFRGCHLKVEKFLSHGGFEFIRFRLCIENESETNVMRR